MISSFVNSTVTTQSTAMSGQRVSLAIPRASSRVAVKINAIFKTNVSSNTAKKASPKVLTSGKDVKAQQFTVGLSEKQGFRVTLGFTKSNELFVGRMAMLGVASSIIGELLTGKGALAQLGIETGLPLSDIEPAILAIIGFNLIAALLPTKGRFVAEGEDLEDRPEGVLQDPSISILDWRRFFGIGGFGFTKENELFVGRVAQLGFAISLIGEALTGKGILAQFDFDTGLPLSETEPLLIAFIAFTLFAAINEGSGRFVDEE